MEARALLISIVPTEALEAAIEALKSRYPGAQVTALVASEPPRNAEEVIAWGGMGARGVVRELRRREFVVAAVVHGGDQYLHRAFWKAALVAAISGARGKALLEAEAGGEIRPISGSELLLAGVAGAGARVITEACVALLALPLLLILAGIVVTDLTERLVGRARKTPRSGQNMISSGPDC
jgi:hypothetical protein